MLPKPRQVRSSRFSSRLRTASRRRREYLAQEWSFALIQGMLCVALAVAAVRSFQAVNAHGEGLALPLKLVMPAAFALGAAIAGRASLRRMREARSLWRARTRRPARTEPGRPVGDDD